MSEPRDRGLIGELPLAPLPDHLAPGLQSASLVEGVLDFVAASPSGRSREPLAVKLDLYRELKELVQ